MATQPVPPGYHTITPQLAIDRCADAIEFYKKAFGAEEIDRAPDPSGKKIWHAALRVGDSMLFVNDVFADRGGEATRANLWLYVPDADALFGRAVQAGAKPTQPPADMFWGDRMAQVVDPFGQTWTLATHKQDMTPDEMKKAADAFIAQTKK